MQHCEGLSKQNELSHETKVKGKGAKQRSNASQEELQVGVKTSLKGIECVYLYRDTIFGTSYKADSLVLLFDRKPFDFIGEI